uniref:Uncharacterized protein n=1 Tax=Opuntia streptacantha TaxID=393608 RepID=A0A7C9EQV5_OPUST
MMSDKRSEWQDRRWHVLLANKQNIAPPKKAKNGQRVIGLPARGAIMFAKSSVMLRRTQTSVWFLLKCSGKQLERTSTMCQLDSDGSICIEGNDVFSSSRSLYRADMFGSEGRQPKRSSGRC